MDALAQFERTRRASGVKLNLSRNEMRRREKTILSSLHRLKVPREYLTRKEEDVEGASTSASHTTFGPFVRDNNRVELGTESQQSDSQNEARFQPRLPQTHLRQPQSWQPIFQNTPSNSYAAPHQIRPFNHHRANCPPANHGFGWIPPRFGHPPPQRHPFNGKFSWSVSETGSLFQP